MFVLKLSGIQNIFADLFHYLQLTERIATTLWGAIEKSSLLTSQYWKLFMRVICMYIDAIERSTILKKKNNIFIASKSFGTLNENVPISCSPNRK